MTATPAPRLLPRVPRIVLAAALLAVATVAVGLYKRLVEGKLGTVSAPFVMGWLPQVDLLGAGVALFGCFAVVLAGRWLVDAERTPKQVAALLFALTLAAGLALNVAREGTAGWTHIFDLEGGTSQSHAINEYLPGLPGLADGVRNYLDRFAEVVPSQTVNVAGHPPGPLLLAHWFGVGSAGGLARLVILVGSCCAPLTYLLARTLELPERSARVAGLLCVASPLILLFGVTSYDYAFAGFATAAACGLVSRDRRGLAAGLVAFAWASLMSWALLAVGAWAVLLVWQRDGFRRALAVGVLCGAVVAAFQGFLAAAYGYDPIGSLRATEQVYRDSLAQVRPYWFWLFGSPVAWALMLGPAIAAAVLLGAQARDRVAVAITAVILVAAVGGFTKAETERIWLYLVPLACVAAAPRLGTSRRGLTLVLSALVAQAFVVELLFNTVW